MNAPKDGIFFLPRNHLVHIKRCNKVPVMCSIKGYFFMCVLPVGLSLKRIYQIDDLHHRVPLIIVSEYDTPSRCDTELRLKWWTREFII